MSEIRLIDSASEIFLPLGSDRVYSDGDQLPPERHLAAAFRHRLQPARSEIAAVPDENCQR